MVRVAWTPRSAGKRGRASGPSQRETRLEAPAEGPDGGVPVSRSALQVGIEASRPRRCGSFCRHNREGNCTQRQTGGDDAGTGVSRVGWRAALV